MFKNYSGTIQCSICQSSQDRQSGRRLESMKKNPSRAKLSHCQHGRSGEAHSLGSLITGRKSPSMRPERRAQSLLSRSLGQICSLLCPNGCSCGVAVCCSAWKTSFTSELPPDREQSRSHCWDLSNNQKIWVAENSSYSRLSHQHQRLCAWGRLSAQLCLSSHLPMQHWVSACLLLLHSNSLHK